MNFFKVLQKNYDQIFRIYKLSKEISLKIKYQLKNYPLPSIITHNFPTQFTKTSSGYKNI